MYNALLVEPADDVIVVLEALPAGGQAVYRDGDATGNVTALNDIPIYHKIAIHPIKKAAISSNTEKPSASPSRISKPASTSMCKT